MLYRTPLRMLGDLVSPKALERILDSGARDRGKALRDLSREDLSDMLKRDVFKRLQLSVPAPLAKKRIQDVLEALEQDSLKNTSIRNEDTLLVSLEASARRFSLYFDWPEVQKLRALLGVTRAEMESGKSVPGLLDEGMGLVAALERRLNEGLVSQAGDIADLRAELSRFAGIGGPKLRRLEGLIAQIEEAQKQDTLSLAEIERARHIALELRKLVESSVVAPAGALGLQDLPDPSLLTPEAQQRLSELDRESEARDLSELVKTFDPLLRVRQDLADELEAARARGEAGTVLGAALTGLKERLGGELNAVLTAQRAELGGLSERFGALEAAGRGRDDARLALEVARATLQGGALATDELAGLERTLRTLELAATGESVGTLLAAQRDLGELERAARGVRGAEEELAPRVAAARAALERGEAPALDELWAVLERRMGQVAQEREHFDARADAVTQEYDRYRHLAGDTIQTLGRLADNVRRTRRLGQLSIKARARYAQQLDQAEALLGEARAEFEAARELTSTFGSDALEGLLGVFDAGEGGLFAPAHFEMRPAPAVALAEQAAEPLALALGALAMHGGARLALLRGGVLSWGNLDPASVDAAKHLVLSGATLGEAQLISVELLEGGLLALPLRDAVLIALVEDGDAFAAWREQLLGARAALL